MISVNAVTKNPWLAWSKSTATAFISIDFALTVINGTGKVGSNAAGLED
jgi:hypothetical protein